jgi:hypothetical protein
VLAGDVDAGSLKGSSDRFPRAFAGGLDAVAIGHPADPVLLILPPLDVNLYISLPREGLKEIENEYARSLGHVYKLRAEQDVAASTGFGCCSAGNAAASNRNDIEGG